MQEQQHREDEVTQKQEQQHQDGEAPQEQQNSGVYSILYFSKQILKEALEKINHNLSSLKTEWQIPDSVRQQRRQAKSGKVFAKVVAWCLTVGVVLAPFAALFSYRSSIYNFLHSLG